MNHKIWMILYIIIDKWPSCVYRRKVLAVLADLLANWAGQGIISFLSSVSLEAGLTHHHMPATLVYHDWCIGKTQFALLFVIILVVWLDFWLILFYGLACKGFRRWACRHDAFQIHIIEFTTWTHVISDLASTLVWAFLSSCSSNLQSIQINCHLAFHAVYNSVHSFASLASPHRANRCLSEMIVDPASIRAFTILEFAQTIVAGYLLAIVEFLSWDWSLTCWARDVWSADLAMLASDFLSDLKWV